MKVTFGHQTLFSNTQARKTKQPVKTIERADANDIKTHLEQKAFQIYQKLKDPQNEREAPIVRVVSAKLSPSEPEHYQFFVPYLYDDPVSLYKQSLEQIPGLTFLPQKPEQPSTYPFEVTLRHIPQLKHIAKQGPDKVQGALQLYIAETMAWHSPTNMASESRLHYQDPNIRL